MHRVAVLTLDRVVPFDVNTSARIFGTAARTVGGADSCGLRLKIGEYSAARIRDDVDVGVDPYWKLRR